MNKTALITGASSGIGEALARLHAKNNGNLIIVARNLKKLEQLKAELENLYTINVYVIAKDLTQDNAPQEIYNDIKTAGIQVDYLINNAGFGGLGKFYERPLVDDINMIQLNVIALTALSHLFLQDFIKLNAGKILNVSSIASLMAGPLQAVYYATKAYVTSFSNALSEELKDTDITVTNLMPGVTKTNFGKTSGMDKTVLFDVTASVETVANHGYYAMLSGKLDVISGLTFSQKILITLIPFIPKKIRLKQISKLQQTK